MKSSFSVLVILVCCNSPLASWGQEKDDLGIFQSRDEYHQFFGGLKSLRDPEINAMLPMIHDFALGRPVGTTPAGKGSNGMMDLLGDPKVRKELEMVDFQYENLKKSNSEIRSRMAKQLKSIDFSNPGSIADQVRRIRDQAEKNLQEVLLPHQLTRLKQLGAQSQLKRRGLVDLLTSDPLKSELEITDRQGGELRQAEKEIQEELAREIARLRERAKEKILSKLRPNQREKVEDLLGESFEFSQQGKKKFKKGKPEKKK